MLISEPDLIFLVEPNNKIEKIYNDCYTDIFNQLKNILGQYHRVQTLKISDIWVRDFAPFFTSKGPIPLLYKPPYQSFQKSYKIQQECLQYFPTFPIPIPIRFDGGNLITNNQCIGISTVKALELNKLSISDMNIVFDITNCFTRASNFFC